MQLRSGSSSSQVLRNKEKESRASQLTARSLNRCRGEEVQIGPTSETDAPAASTPQSMAGWVAGNGEGEEGEIGPTSETDAQGMTTTTVEQVCDCSEPSPCLEAIETDIKKKLSGGGAAGLRGLDWGSWDPVTGLPRIDCADTVTHAHCKSANLFTILLVVTM